MMRESGPGITGIGMYVPDHTVTNDDLSRIVDTSDKWIVERTGIRTRRRSSPEQATSDLVFAAASQALEMAHIDPGHLDKIMVATATPDYIFPTTSAIVQGRLGAVNASAVDIAAACTGGIEALSLAFGLHQASMVNTSLVAGGMKSTRRVK